MNHSQLSKLLDEAKANNWCTRVHCTTCGSHQYRNELTKFERMPLLHQLSELTEGYFEDRNAILLIIYRLAELPMARDLLVPLGNSPAGRFLQKAIEIQERRDENRRRQEAMSAPEAIAVRELERKDKKRQRSEINRIQKTLNIKNRT